MLKIALVLFKCHRKVDLPWTETGVVAGADTTSLVHADALAEYITMSSSFLQSQIDCGIQQIVYVRELIVHYEYQISQFRLLLRIGVRSGQKRKRKKKGDNSSGRQTDEVGPSGTHNMDIDSEAEGH